MQLLEVTAHIDFNPDFSIGCQSLAKRVARQIGHCCAPDSPALGDPAGPTGPHSDRQALRRHDLPPHGLSRLKPSLHPKSKLHCPGFFAFLLKLSQTVN